MRKYIIVCAAATALSFCAKNSEPKDTSWSEVSNAIEAQISTINSATSDINTGSPTALSSLSPAEQRLLNEESLWQKAGSALERLFDSSLHAIAFSCSSGSVNDSGSFGSASSLTITRTWNNCIGDGGHFKRNGIVYLGWTGLNTSSPYVQNGSVLKRATSGLTITRTSTGNYVEISGNDSAHQVSGSNANQILTWSSVSGSSRTFTLHIDETRTGKSSGGTTLFRHVVTTPTDMTISVDTAASTRAITSGSIKVHHALANIDVVTTFNNAVWDINTCQPKSGSATVAVSGSKSGSGNITFNNGTVSFTYGSASGTLTLPGC
jgi:hypothetical protein